MSITMSENGNSNVQLGEVVRFPKWYRCHLQIVKDEDGGYSAIALNLPGAGSCGDTPEDAIANAKEAIAGVIASYHDDNQEIPWLAPTDYVVPAGVDHRWIIVDVE